MAVGPPSREFDSKEVVADGKETMGESPAFRNYVSGGFVAAGIHIPKSVLTARSSPERSAEKR